MPSSYSASLRFEKQFTGENVNTWGDRLNTLFERADFSIAGLSTIALTGNYSLTSSNTADDEARSAMLKFTGSTLSTVTIPSVSKLYLVWNACTVVVTLTTGSGTTVALDPGDMTWVYCDGTNVKTLGFGVSGTTSALKDYIALTVAGGSSVLPSVTGHSGKLLTNNGTASSWVQPTVSYLSDYSSDQTTRDAQSLADATDIAAALAIAL